MAGSWAGEGAEQGAGVGLAGTRKGGVTIAKKNQRGGL